MFKTYIIRQLTILLIIFLIPSLGKTQNILFKKVKLCTFSIEIPIDMKIKKMNDSSPDYCDYEVSLKDGYTIMELHSLISSRFLVNTIRGLYDGALDGSDLEITYNMIGSDFFVISGINKENGNIVYWKRILAAEFVKDLHIEYNQSRKPDIEKYISRISKSFTSN